jgi:hypothetical protein
MIYLFHVNKMLIAVTKFDLIFALLDLLWAKKPIAV